MKAGILLACLLLAACDPAPSELTTIKEARSSAAEWAKVNELAAQHKVTATYAATMRDEARSQLTKAAAALPSSQSEVAQIIERVLALPPDAPATALAEHAAKLKQLEDRLAVS
jgi:hypothetical protein